MASVGRVVSEPDVQALGDRIEQLLDELQATGDPRALRHGPRSCSGW